MPTLTLSPDAAMFLGTGTFFLNPDMPYEFPVPLPMTPGPNSTLIVALDLHWEVNPNATLLIQQLPLLPPQTITPVLHFSYEGSFLLLSWEPADATLWFAPTVNGPWLPLPAPSPVSIDPHSGPTMQFFRVSVP